MLGHNGVVGKECQEECLGECPPVLTIRFIESRFPASSFLLFLFLFTLFVSLGIWQQEQRKAH